MKSRHFRQFCATCIIALATTLSCAAQAIRAPQSFDVASLRRSTGGASDVGATPNGYHAINVPLLRLIAAAYAPTAKSDPIFEYDRIVGAPDWARTDNYTLNARVANSDLRAWLDPELQKAMLRDVMQTLLVERCKLTAHREIRELVHFALVPAKGGSKLKEDSTTNTAELQRQHPGGLKFPDGGFLVRGDGTMSFYGVSMATLAGMLSVPAGHPVQDQTGLSSRYDFTLQLRDSGATAAEPDPMLSIFTVMPEQLGLRLQSEKGQVEVLVIDHIERPSEN